MKFLYFLTFLLYLSGLKAQNINSLTTTDDGNKYNFPEVIKPSQESFYRTQFGNVPTNEYKGMQNLSIPIYTLKNGDITVPINLNYVKLGVKVNDVPNDVGMNWILETGGVINRTINNIADDIALERKYFDSYDQLSQLNTGDGTPGATELNRLITKGKADTEVDYFNFTYPGNSGSFYLDRNFVPVLITDGKNCIIEFDRNTSEFTISDNSGMKYFYGGVNATEETGNRHDFNTKAITSYYITGIVDTKGNIVNYQYSNKEIRSYALETNQQQLIIFDYKAECEAYFSGDYSLQEAPNMFTIKNPVVLDKIISNDVEIVFNRVSSLAATTQLNGIKIFNKKIPINEIKFNYISQDLGFGEERFFLDKIENFAINNNTNSKKDEYVLEYDGALSLPTRTSYSIDYLGYYNGAGNNVNLLPNTDYFNNTFKVFNNYGIGTSIKGTADRRPNFAFAKKGTLRSITYPTKGQTVFEYEPIMAREKKYKNQDITIRVYHNGPTESFYDLNGSDVDSTAVNIKVRVSSPAGPSVLNKGEFIVQVINKANNNIVLEDMLSLPRVNENDYIDAIYTLPIDQNINYRIILKIGRYCRQCEGRLQINNFPSGWQITEDFGIRLKRQYDTEGNGNINIKRYYYSSYSKINDINSVNEKFQPLFNSVFIKTAYAGGDWVNNCVGGSGGAAVSSAYHYITSQPYQNSFDYKNPSYEYVTVSHGGDNFEKGGEEIQFVHRKFNTIDNLVIPQDFPSPILSNSSGFSLDQLQSKVEEKKQYFTIYNGRLLLKKTLKRNANGLFMDNIVKNIYSKIDTKKIYSIFGTQVYEKIEYRPGVQPGSTTSNLYIAAYPLSSYYYHLVNTSTKQYFEDIPLNILDDSPYKKLETTTQSVYSNPSHNQLTSQRTTSTDGSCQTTEYSYASEKGNAYLEGKNMIGIPLVTQSTKGVNGVTKIISKTETLYPINQTDANNTTSGLPLPKSVSSLDLVTGNMSTEVTYDQYDAKGNLQQYTTRSGISTAIVWGYNNTQPIAKIEGAKYSQVSAYIANIVSKSDADSTTGTTASEQDLVDALDLFRQKSELSGFQITTYTYDPLVGVRSVTPASGIRENYIYDDANRLKEVRDVNGRILKENKYKYKQ